MKKKPLLLSLIMGIIFTTQAQTISTVAGNGTHGYLGDGGAATAAEMYFPPNIVTDKPGNLYIADPNNYRVRVVNSSGIITTFAGNGTQNFSGDGGPATAAEINLPCAVAIDNTGNLLIVEQGSNCIRKVNTSGIISTIAGTPGPPGFSGDGGPATAAEFNTPFAIGFDASGNYYIVDRGNNRIRKVNTSGMISTLVGNGTSGFSGDGGPATAAKINFPSGVAADGSGNIYFTDGGNHRVRVVNTSGTITTFAGNGTASYSGDGGPATAAELNWPFGLTFDISGNLYIGDGSNNRVRMVKTSGNIYTVAGNGTAAFNGDGGPATVAELNGPEGVAFDTARNFYIADAGNNRIRKVKGLVLTGFDEPEKVNESVRLYPNPNNGIFNLEVSSGNLNNLVEVYNMLGEEVYATKLSSLSAKLNLSNNPSGIYLYRILSQSGSLVSTGKFIIQK